MNYSLSTPNKGVSRRKFDNANLQKKLLISDCKNENIL